MDTELEKYRRSRLRWIGAATLTIFLLIVSYGFQLYLSYKDYLSAIDDNLEKLSLALLKQAEAEFSTTELLLRMGRSRLQSAQNPDDWNPEEVYQLFKELMEPFNQTYYGKTTTNLFWIRSNGEMLVSSYTYPSPPINVQDRHYFLLHEQDKSPDILYSGSIQSRLTGRWVVLQTARVNNSDGQFAGVIGVSTRIDTFGIFSEELNIGEGGSIVVASKSGRWAYRFPFRDDFESVKFLETSSFKSLESRLNGKSLFEKSPFDNEKRRVGFHWDENQDLVALVTMTESAAWDDFAPLFNQRLLILVLTIGVLLAAMIAYNQVFKKGREAMQLAVIDGLTQIPNRRFFDERLEQVWLSALRDNKSIGLIFIDIDYFKRYNDAYGHEAGDLCLRRVATTIDHELKRPDDFLARYGGEEFIVLVPGNDIDSTRQVATALLESIRRAKIPHPNSPIGEWLTISVGFSAGTPTPGLESRQLKACADQALYAAKAQGRDRVVGMTLEQLRTQ